MIYVDDLRYEATLAVRLNGRNRVMRGRWSHLLSDSPAGHEIADFLDRLAKANAGGGCLRLGETGRRPVRFVYRVTERVRKAALLLGAQPIAWGSPKWRQFFVIPF